MSGKQLKLDAFLRPRPKIPPTEPTPVQIQTPPQVMEVYPKLEENHSFPDDSMDSDSDVPLTRRRKKARPLMLDDDEEPTNASSPRTTEEPPSPQQPDTVMEPASPSRPRRLKKKAPDADEPPATQDSIQEELDFLNSNDVLEERTRGRKQSSYSLALQKLKNRKLALDEFDNGAEGPMDRYHSTRTIDPSDEDEDDMIWREDAVAEDEEDEADEDDNFIVDDDTIDGQKVFRNESTAVMLETMMPAEFSSARVQTFSYHFKIYIECLVNLTKTPDFAETENVSYFQLATRVVEQRVKGYQNSLLTSDAWLPEFKEALDHYPVWTRGNADVNPPNVSCEGCRTNKPASRIAILSHDVSHHDDEANNGQGKDDDDDETESDRISFSLGRSCYRRAHVYHRLHHFRTHMKNRVADEIEAIYRQRQTTDSNSDLWLVEDLNGTLLKSGFVDEAYHEVLELFEEADACYLNNGRKLNNHRGSETDSD
ncbi:uncharacterized protein BYT42DRAFT_615637 [Radiomyces spectabilis]|uniref:uncharacterized protein n=1 Tax=Radiomyces spectabilis TaxID=64574 RepID=UPI00221E5617|nr:uncharacterized protein BYT42DRAFT_615637 [Radiomyces spectabilis]KAI8374478.1 hypothetical protein BYT42DRAFT_615637 [Radiomyces spectabilis]